MKRYLSTLVSLAILACGSAFAQNCGPVVDEARIIKGSIASNPLVDQGVDVHVVTIQNVSKYGHALADAERAYEQQCPSWLADGHRKPNLFVMMVAPNDRLKNVFFGSALTGAFENTDTVNTIYSQAANPYFRQRDWVGGINAALKDFAAKDTAYHDQQKHPASTTINEQPTDFHGLWVVLGWIVGIFAIAALFASIIALFSRRKKTKAEAFAAQQYAIDAQHKVDLAFRSVDTKRIGYDMLLKTYTTMSQTVSLDPHQSGLSASEYQSIAATWKDFKKEIDQSSSPTAAAEKAAANTSPNYRTAKSRHKQKDFSKPREQYRQPTPEPNPSTVIVNDNSSGLLTGMVIGESLSRERDREPEPVREPERHHREEPSFSSGSDSDWGSGGGGGGGSDSSWGSSDGGSSSVDFGGGGGGGSDSSW